MLSDGRLSGRIIYWPGGGKATTTVPELEPTFFLPLIFRQTLGRRCFSPPAACCCRCQRLSSFRSRPPTFLFCDSLGGGWRCWWWDLLNCRYFFLIFRFIIIISMLLFLSSETSSSLAPVAERYRVPSIFV